MKFCYCMSMAESPNEKEAFSTAVNDALLKLPLLFKPGKTIAEKELRALGNPEADIGEILEYAKIRGVLTIDAANAQIQYYISQIPQDRRQPFRSLIEQGMKTARETEIDSASAIGSVIGTSGQSTFIEKMMGFDLYIAQQLELERLRESGEA